MKCISPGWEEEVLHCLFQHCVSAVIFVQSSGGRPQEESLEGTLGVFDDLSAF